MLTTAFEPPTGPPVCPTASRGPSNVGPSPLSPVIGTPGPTEILRIPTPPPVPAAQPQPPQSVPVQQPQTSRPGHVSSLDPSASGTGSSLYTLVVDDDALTRKLMSRMLRRLGHHVLTAENGKLGLDLIRQSHEGVDGVPRIAIVFLDNQMPQMSGVEVARATRAMRSNIYIAGCTGNALQEDQDEYRVAGADVLIPKPVHQSSVIEALECARRRLEMAAE